MDNLGKNFKAKYLNIPSHAPGQKNASIWKRALAFIIDLIIINIFLFPPFSNIISNFMSGKTIADFQTAIPDYIYTSIFLLSIIVLLYFSLLEHYAQQTFGMMLMKIYVVPKPGFWRAIVRNIFLLPFFPLSLLWIIEPIYLYFKGTRLLEKLTNTSTVEVTHV